MNWQRRNFWISGNGWENPSSEARIIEFPVRASWEVVPEDGIRKINLPFREKDRIEIVYFWVVQDPQVSKYIDWFLTIPNRLYVFCREFLQFLIPRPTHKRPLLTFFF